MQLIKRKIEAEVQTSQNKAIQVSYNSDGHLTIRRKIEEDQDELIVFDSQETSEIIAFLKRAAVKLADCEDLPF